jgi:drug/metabolite transporter (DMT)-like permease
MRITSCLATLVYLARRPTRRRGSGRMSIRTLALIMAVGVTDSLAELFFATASTSGMLSVVSVLSSLYPVITVALAFTILRERVHWLQSCGAVTALVGVVLLANR